MPMKPPTACTRCGRLYCTDHKRPAWQKRVPTPRIRGRKLQRERKRLFTEQLWCVHCLKEGKCTLPMIRDHIVPLAEGGEDVYENTQPLCQVHSDAKTQQEALRGMRR
jgi:5-methylcytosine-specific restriction protein A